MSNAVHFKIRELEFTLKSEYDSEYLGHIVEFVNKKLEDISRKTNVIDSQKLMLLTAINIADDLFQLKDDLNELQDKVENRIDDLMKLLAQEGE